MLKNARGSLQQDDTSFVIGNGASNQTTIAANGSSSSHTLTLPNLSGADTIVSRTSTDTLTNKALTSPTINGGTALTTTSTELNQIAGISVGGGTSGDIVTIDGSQTLTNKSINATQLTGTIADVRIASSSITQHGGDIDHDALTNFSALEHINWTAANNDFVTTGSIDAGSIINGIGVTGGLTSDYISVSSTTVPSKPASVMTTAQKNATTPSTGDQVYDTTLGKLQIYNGGWTDAGIAAPLATPSVDGLVSTTTQSFAGQKSFQDGNVTLTVGADASATTLTDATGKSGRIGIPHYTNAEEPMAMLYGIADVSNNKLRIGGGSGSLNAATEIKFYTASNNTTVDGTERMSIDSAGDTTITGRLDVVQGDVSLVIGGDENAPSRTDATTKFSRLGGAHYTNAEEPAAMIYSIADSTENKLWIGGGSSGLNTATVIKFFTAANTTTTLGTERMSIDSAGTLTVTNTDATLNLDATRGTGHTYAFQTSGVNAESFTLQDVDNSHAAFLYTAGSGGSWNFYTNNTNRLQIEADGKVNIFSADSSDELMNVRGTNATSTNDTHRFVVSDSSGQTKVHIGYANPTDGTVDAGYWGLRTNTGGFRYFWADPSGALRSTGTAADIGESDTGFVVSDAGTYTPVITIVAGSLGTIRTAKYQRNGNIVSVQGHVSGNATNVTGNFEMRVGLPPGHTSNFGSQHDCSGVVTMSASSTSPESAFADANIANDDVRVRMYTTATSATTISVYYSFMYEVK